MIYLVILVLVAGVGISSLWVQQRRQRAHLETVQGFRTSLEAISPHSAPGPFRRALPHNRARGGAGRPIPLDPARREAARVRVEARRSAALQRAHQRRVQPHPAPRRRSTRPQPMRQPVPQRHVG